jgi:3-hydroxyacyl-[acyl-carrier-protein] dehydratase
VLDDLHQLIKSVRRARLVPDGVGTPVRFGADALHRLIPHRAPMLLVDTIDVVSVDTAAVRGSRELKANDLGFAGHFPDEPIYPGMLVVEAMGQIGLTLLHFADGRRTDVPADLGPRRVRATHIHHAAFLAPFRPGDTMTLHAQLAHSDYTFVALGQAWNGDTLAAVAVSEVFVDE